MRVLQFSTGHSGGAGLAARRLNSGLVNLGLDSKFYALENANYSPDNDEFVLHRRKILVPVSKLNTWISGYLSSKVFFSIKSVPGINLIRLLRKYDRKKTILHFHNWFNLLDLSTLDKLLGAGYKVVITLHDQRFFTGGCHYSLGCSHYESTCASCPLVPKFFWGIVKNNRLRLIKYRNLNKIVVITPSAWMKETLLKSEFIPKENIFVLDNIISESVSDKLLRREFVSQPFSRRIRVGIAAMDPNSYVKAGDVYRDLIAYVQANDLEIDFIELRNEKFQNRPIEYFWNSIDFLLHLSRADNSPNVIKEAKIYGVPVIATDIGGISESIQLGFDQLIDVDEMNSHSIVECVLSANRAHRDIDTRLEIARIAASNSSLSLQRHLDLYRKILIS